MVRTITTLFLALAVLFQTSLGCDLSLAANTAAPTMNCHGSDHQCDTLSSHMDCCKISAPDHTAAVLVSTSRGPGLFCPAIQTVRPTAHLPGVTISKLDAQPRLAPALERLCTLQI